MHFVLRSRSCSRWLVACLLLPGACTIADINETIGEVNFYRHQGFEAYERGDLDKAIESYGIAVSKCYSLRKGLYLSLEEIDNKSSLDASAMEAIGECRGIQAEMCYVLGRQQECIDYADEALHDWYRPRLESSRIATVHAARGLAQLAKGNRQEAIVDLRAARELLPEHKQVRRLDWELARSTPAAVRANQLFAKQSWQDAAAAYAEALLAYPHPNLLLQRGIALNQLRNYRDACQDLDACIAQGIDDANAWYQRGIARMYTGNIDGAIADCTKVIEMLPTSTAGYFNRGACRERLSPPALELAQQDFSKVLQLAPGDILAFEARARIRYQLHDIEGAHADLRRAQELGSPRAAEIRRAGDEEQAAEDDRRATGINLDDPAEFYAAWSRALAQQGEPPPAAAQQETLPQYAARIGFEDFRGMEESYAHFAAWRNPEAIEALNKVIAAAPERALAWFLRGEIRLSQGLYTDAMTDFEEAVRLAPDNSNCYLQRGHTELRLGNYAKAIADSTRTIELDPDSIDGYAIRGWARHLAADDATAVRDLTMALVGDRAQPWVYNLLAWILATSEVPGLLDPPQAVRLAKICLQKVPDEANYLDTLACANAAAGDFAAAAAIEKQAIERCKDDASRADFERNLSAFLANKTYLDRIREERARDGKDGRN